MRTNSVKKRQTLTKVCGVAYEHDDINSIVQFAISKGYNYYYIYHNPETDEKKSHYHFIIESDRLHRFVIDSLVSESLTINLFEKCADVGAYLRYVTHVDYDCKSHYESTDIISNVDIFTIQRRIDKAYNYNVPKSEINAANFKIVYQAIFEYNIVSFKRLLAFCFENDIEYQTSWSWTLNQVMKDYKEALMIERVKNIKKDIDNDIY